MGTQKNRRNFEHPNHLLCKKITIYTQELFYFAYASLLFYLCVLLHLGAVDSKIFLFYTADWSIMNMINDEILSPITCLDVSQDCTFLMAGKYKSNDM